MIALVIGIVCLAASPFLGLDAERNGYLIILSVVLITVAALRLALDGEEE